MYVHTPLTRSLRGVLIPLILLCTEAVLPLRGGGRRTTEQHYFELFSQTAAEFRIKIQRCCLQQTRKTETRWILWTSV